MSSAQILPVATPAQVRAYARRMTLGTRGRSPRRWPCMRWPRWPDW